jgi:hypothetical protein
MEEQVTQWTVKIEQDDQGELVLTLPTELMARAGWTEGTKLEWIDLQNGAWELRKL